MKPAHVEAMYTTCILYPVKEIEQKFNVSWEDVKDYWIKWGTLYLEMFDGTIYNFERKIDDSWDLRDNIDWKRPSTMNLLSDDYEVIEVIENE
jgi:hypothetical protein